MFLAEKGGGWGSAFKPKSPEMLKLSQHIYQRRIKGWIQERQVMMVKRRKITHYLNSSIATSVK
ncbi:hypothetical protein HSBAA_20880 [Vreelandella sulfidaeris]|uniref:Uncharacterized protein n=1 Tax=Vreelandella sulfidaeris TaxID=115553 RepID=A0A455U3Z4_9GAMM|nr:hypothetical protein HSBAA_20880 [Halomonas sulfidaeris]